MVNCPRLCGSSGEKKDEVSNREERTTLTEENADISSSSLDRHSKSSVNNKVPYSAALKSTGSLPLMGEILKSNNFSVESVNFKRPFAKLYC